MTRAPRLPDAFRHTPLAHRGLHGPGRPENSREAIDAAIAHGYGIEIDLQLSADDVPMVFHDDQLDRMTHTTGPLRDRTAADLAQLELRGGPSAIPTLPYILAHVAGHVPLLIELKDQSGTLSAGPERLEQSTAKALAGYPGPLALLSFNPHVLKAIGKRLQFVALGLATSAATSFETNEQTGPSPSKLNPSALETASFVSHDARDPMARKKAEMVRKSGRAILCWTIRSETEEAEARTWADGITFEHYLPSAPAP